MRAMKRKEDKERTYTLGQLVKNTGINRHTIQYRKTVLGIQHERGIFTQKQAEKIINFNKIKNRKKPVIYEKLLIPYNKIEIIKVTEVYHIYESKINKL